MESLQHRVQDAISAGLSATKAKEIQSLGVDDWREVMEQWRDLEVDFEVNDYRFISTDEIDEIMTDELLGDEYTLGMFNAWFIADILDIPLDAVEKMQKAEAFEGIGALMAQKIDQVQKEYVSADGYGHHFAHYDGNEQEIRFNDTLFHVFRVN